MSVAEPSSFRLIASLATAGLVSGLILVGVYLGTLPRIQQNQAEALERAIFKVLPGATGFRTMRIENGQLTELVTEGTVVAPGEVVYAAAADDGQLIGYAVPAAGPGFMDTITLLYGFDATRRVIVGLEVLESRETPGLGDKIVGDAHFHENFAALEVEPTIDAVKRGEKTAANQVDCITGATISSKAVIAILNKSMEHWLSLVGAPPTDDGLPSAAGPVPNASGHRGDG